MFPSLFKELDNEKLRCDTCELANIDVYLFLSIIREALATFID